MMKVLLFIILSFSFCWAEETKLVEVPGLGKVQGYYENGYTTFRGIEYGRITENFNKSEPYGEFEEEIYDADWKPECPTSSTISIIQGIEQCLILKIDTKSFTENYPVIVFIPGYDLSSGSALETSADFVMKKDVVLVTVQFRLDVYGFLSIHEDNDIANNGVFDILLALKWIKQYIEYFGGDSNRITLLGHHQSAGLIHLMTLSKHFEGLFHQVIYHSGSAYMKEFHLMRDVKIHELLECPDENVRECLSEATPSSIANNYRNKYDGTFGPVLGGAFLDDASFDEQEFRSYPTIVGFTKSNTDFDFDEFFNETFVKYVELLSTYGDNENRKHFEIPTEKLYTTLYDVLSHELDSSSKSNSPDVNELGIYKLISLNNDKNFLFVFDYISENNFETVPFNDDLSIYYFMKNIEHEYSEKDLKMVDFIVDFWTSFATDGVPIYADMIEWPAVVEDNGPFLKLSFPMSFGTKIMVEQEELTSMQLSNSS